MRPMPTAHRPIRAPLAVLAVVAVAAGCASQTAQGPTRHRAQDQDAERSFPPAAADRAVVEQLVERVHAGAEAHFEENPYSQVWIAVDTAALDHNASRVKEGLGDRGLCAVVKGDAYGHGLALAAPVFAPYADAFCLTENAEAAVLKALDLGPRLVRIRLASRAEVERALVEGLQLEEFLGSLGMARAFDEAVAEHAADADARLAVHVVLDSTGMGRNGFPMGPLRDRSLAELAEVAALPRLRIVGITAHLPGADAADFGPTLEKARQFLDDAEAVHQVVAEHGHAPQWHLSNSAASARLPADIHAKLHLDRVGGTLYGQQTYERQDLTPWRESMTVISHVAAVHERNAGDTLGYGSTAAVPEDGFTTANIGVGWLNLPRQLSNRGYVLDQRGGVHPILGKVSMNTIVVAAQSAGGPDLVRGAPVLLLSPLGPTIADTARRIGQPPSYVTLAIAKSNAARFAY